MTLAVAMRTGRGITLAADKRLLESDGTILTVDKLYELDNGVHFALAGDTAPCSRFYHRTYAAMTTEELLDLCLSMKEEKGVFYLLAVDPNEDGGAIFMGWCGAWERIEDGFVAIGAGSGPALGVYKAGFSSLAELFMLVSEINASVSPEFSEVTL